MKQRTVGSAPRQGVADGLEQRHEHQQDHHADIHDVLVMQVLSIVDGEASDAAGADRARHGGEADQADRRDRHHADQVGNRLVQVHAEDDAELAAAHGRGRLDLAGVHARQRHLNLPGEEGHRAEHQRNDGALDTDGRSHNEAGQRDQEDQQNHKGDRAEDVRDEIHNAVDDPVLGDAAGSRHRQQDTENRAEDEGQSPRDQEHLCRCQTAVRELVRICHHIRHDTRQPFSHARSPPLSHHGPADTRSRPCVFPLPRR